MCDYLEFGLELYVLRIKKSNLSLKISQFFFLVYLSDLSALVVAFFNH
jgi:hypothetical protein